MINIKITDTESGQTRDFETNAVFAAINEYEQTNVIVFLQDIRAVNYIDMLAAVYKSLKGEIKERFGIDDFSSFFEFLDTTDSLSDLLS